MKFRKKKTENENKPKSKINDKLSYLEINGPLKHSGKQCCCSLSATSSVQIFKYNENNFIFLVTFLRKLIIFFS